MPVCGATPYDTWTTHMNRQRLLIQIKGSKWQPLSQLSIGITIVKLRSSLVMWVPIRKVQGLPLLRRSHGQFIFITSHTWQDGIYIKTGSMLLNSHWTRPIVCRESSTIWFIWIHTKPYIFPSVKDKRILTISQFPVTCLWHRIRKAYHGILIHASLLKPRWRWHHIRLVIGHIFF